MERQLQKQQHEQNQKRFESLEESHKELLASQGKQNESLARIEENTKSIPHLTDRVGALEEERGKIKGAIAGAGALGPLFALGLKIFKG